MLPVNPVGGAFCAPSKSLSETCFPFSTGRQDSPAAFFFDEGTAMSDAVIPTRYRLRVKQRLVVLAYVEEHGLKPAARHFALSRTTVREWRDRHRDHGFPGLLPRYPKRRRRRLAAEAIPLVKVARTEHRFGAARTRIWLQRVHGISVATQTITRLFRDLGLNRLPSRRKRRPKQMRLFAKDQPGDSVQVDVKFVRVNRQRYFQYTALDDCTRFRVLRLYRQLNHRSSLAFFRELREAMPFPDGGKDLRRAWTGARSRRKRRQPLDFQSAPARNRSIHPEVGITNRVFVGDAAVEFADRHRAVRLCHSNGRTQEQRINQAVDRRLSANRQTQGRGAAMVRSGWLANARRPWRRS
jgi:transposase